MKFKLEVMAAACVATMIASSPLSAATLTTGSGDGSLILNVDEFGRSESAIYDPVGEIAAADAFFDSFIAFVLGGVRVSPSGPFELVSQTSDRLVTRWTIGSLAVQLTQSVSGAFDANGLRTGSLFSQQFSITNTADVPNSFDVVRYLDGDLRFDGSIADGGGVIQLAGSRVLYETDATSGSAAASTFVGITTTGGNTPAASNFEIDAYDRLEEKVLAGGTLNNQITGDTDGDQFIDQPYDVTLAIQDFISLAAGQQLTWTTNTLFGNAVPPAPGSTEALPLLPEPVPGGFLFEIDPNTIRPLQTIFIDPVIAVGYTYDVTGASFASVTAPTFGTVADPNGYTLIFTNAAGSQSLALASGQTLSFLDLGGAVTSFRIEGIDEALMLDPLSGVAFVTGVALTDFTSSVIRIVQSPITFDTDAAVVPLPAGAWLMMTGLAAFAAQRRLRQRNAPQ